MNNQASLNKLNKAPKDYEQISDWRPTATLETLRLRAQILKRIREFFTNRDVLEVETPLLSEAGATDLHLQSMTTTYRGPGIMNGRKLSLQTSPEFAMKRLLAAGSGPIYQVCKAFRNGEFGRRHNPEFTMLEWYRPGYDHFDLMAEIEQLISAVFNFQFDSEYLSYQQAFEKYTNINPHAVSLQDLKQKLDELGFSSSKGVNPDDRDAWLDLLLTHVIEPQLGNDRLTFVYDFPISKAALAIIRPGDPPLAERFELYIKGIEIANGYHELLDGQEQRLRFENDRIARRKAQLTDMHPDSRLLAAMDHGLPPCSGVAMGVDRLLILAAGLDHIDDVLAFPVHRA